MTIYFSKIIRDLGLSAEKLSNYMVKEDFFLTIDMLVNEL